MKQIVVCYFIGILMQSNENERVYITKTSFILWSDSLIENDSEPIYKLDIKV